MPLTAASAPARERDAYAMFTKAPPAVFVQRWSVWAAGFGGSQTTDGNAAVGSNTATSSIYGTAVGADYSFSPFTIAGFALAGGGTNFSRQRLRHRAFRPVPGRRLHPAHASGRPISRRTGLWLAGHHHQPHRHHRRHRSAAGALQRQCIFGPRSKAAIVSSTPWMGVTPYAAAQFTTFDLPAYAEQAIVGTNTLRWPTAPRDVTDTRSELGIRTDKSWAMTDGILTLRGRFAWAHDYDPNRNRSAPPSRRCRARASSSTARRRRIDSALTTASAEMKWLSGWSAAATFEGEFSACHALLCRQGRGALCVVSRPASWFGIRLVKLSA